MLRLLIENSLDKDDFVTFDFSDVVSVSHSFADECFGKLLLEYNIIEIKKISKYRNSL